ncbi:hypothetical protein INS49_012413 [Diaporthe citri]|uniref:uncharacterized protein n=1 Tax=Diaporthe citri TaxID=83186 RepID=UPI001C81C1AB|nr:uncharacterized protein INS49_012413 [Diaporthe citri]KAG6358893.1 hypothetical protein INS49_012413 [Diaporthe citri]
MVMVAHLITAIMEEVAMAATTLETAITAREAVQPATGFPEPERHREAVKVADVSLGAVERDHKIQGQDEYNSPNSQLSLAQLEER